MQWPIRHASDHLIMSLPSQLWYMRQLALIRLEVMNLHSQLHTKCIPSFQACQRHHYNIHVVTMVRVIGILATPPTTHFSLYMLCAFNNSQLHNNIIYQLDQNTCSPSMHDHQQGWLYLGCMYPHCIVVPKAISCYMICRVFVAPHYCENNSYCYGLSPSPDFHGYINIRFK